jgi:hypothetical protein
MTESFWIGSHPKFGGTTTILEGNFVSALGIRKIEVVQNYAHSYLA